MHKSGLIKCGLYALSLGLLLTGLSIGYSDKANAHALDSAISELTTADAQIQYANPTRDLVTVTNTWTSYWQNTTCSPTNANLSDWLTALESGTYLMIQRESTSNGTDYDRLDVEYYYSTSPLDLKLEVSGPSSNNYQAILKKLSDGTSPSDQDLKRVVLSYWKTGSTYYPNGEPGVFCSSSDGLVAASSLGQYVLNNHLLQGRGYILQTNIPSYADDNTKLTDFPETLQTQYIEPDYRWSVSDSGILNVKYLKNLEEFFNGRVNVFAYRYDNDEGYSGSQTEIQSDLVSGHAENLNHDLTAPLPGAGYYHIGIDHVDPLSIPPWDLVPGRYEVETKRVQFYWDGKTPLNGTTTGCGINGKSCGGDEESPVTVALNKMKIDTNGLESIIYKPIQFLSTLTNLEGSCTPINIPNFMGGTMQLQCLRSYIGSGPLAPILTIGSVITSAMVVLWLSFKSFALIKRTSSPNNDDRIEVISL